MSIVQEYINADETYEVANQILVHDLPNIDDCDADERETFISECRWALTEKIKQVALMHAFREDPLVFDQSLRQLCETARGKISNSSFMASVREFVLMDMGVADRDELHPNLQVVEAETLVTCNRVIKALGRNIIDATETTLDEAA